MKGIRLVKIVWSIMLLSFLGACGEKENEDKRTLIFSRYMDQAFGVKIPEEQQFYVIVPSSGCQGAIGIALIEINEYLEEHNCQLTFVSNNELTIKEYLNPNQQVYMDKENLLDRINLPITNTTIISTKDHKIDQVIGSKDCEISISKRFFKILEKANYCNI